MKSTTCILISSCEKYRPLAEWTANRIGRFWQEHPQIYFSGLKGDGEFCLPYSCDARDWMGVTHAAVEALISKGYYWLYLILDDLPPLAQCHTMFLNQLLPQKAQELNATYVGLLGWGQHRSIDGDGKILEKEVLWLEQLSSDYRWKFSLHPGLWNTERLLDLLTIRMQQFRSSEHTPWNFERHRDDTDKVVPQIYLQSCYRICGERFDSAPGKHIRKWSQSLGLFMVDILLFLKKITHGTMEREQMATRWLWPYCYYRGPYPLFWSGVMRQGGASAEWVKFIRWFNPGGIRQEWETVQKKLQPT